MKNLCKKSISLLMAIIMVLGMLPAVALAAARRELEAAGVSAELYAAPRDGCSGWMGV